MYNDPRVSPPQQRSFSAYECSMDIFIPEVFLSSQVN